MILFLDGKADAANLEKLGNLTGEALPIRLTEKLGSDHLPGGAMRVASGDFHSRCLRLFEGVRRQNLAQLEFYDLYHAAAIGLGTLLICNFSVAEVSSNLSRQRLFPAWIHEMLLRMNPHGSAAQESFLIGDSVAGETWAAEAGGRALRGPGGAAVKGRSEVTGERMRV